MSSLGRGQEEEREQALCKHQSEGGVASRLGRPSLPSLLASDTLEFVSGDIKLQAALF